MSDSKDNLLYNDMSFTFKLPDQNICHILLLQDTLGDLDEIGNSALYQLACGSGDVIAITRARKCHR